MPTRGLIKTTEEVGTTRTVDPKLAVVTEVAEEGTEAKGVAVEQHTRRTKSEVVSRWTTVSRSKLQSSRRPLRPRCRPTIGSSAFREDSQTILTNRFRSRRKRSRKKRSRRRRSRGRRRSSRGRKRKNSGRSRKRRTGRRSRRRSRKRQRRLRRTTETNK